MDPKNPNTGKKSQTFCHRPYLDSLRGFACFIVILFHCELPAFSNGFLGVDIFFVLSGYLITSILLRKLYYEHRLKYCEFYSRRFQRLFPASSLTLILTAIIYRYVELNEYVNKHTNSFIASSFYYSNWYNLRVASDYFTDKGSDQSPVVHFWSLSIEEQFYLFYPVVIAIIYKISKKKTSITILVFASLFVFSFSLNMKLYEKSHMMSYFSTWGRLYQLFAGALAASILFHREITETNFCHYEFRNSEKFRLLITAIESAIGFAIVTMLIFIAKSTFNALILGFTATTFTFFLILVFEVTGEKNFTKKLLSQNTYLKFIGKISYSMYLTHVPITKIGDILEVFPFQKVPRALLILSITVVISTIIWHSVEKPAKNTLKINKNNEKQVLLAFIISTFLVASILNVILTSKFLWIQKTKSDFKNSANFLLLSENIEHCENLKKLGDICLAGDSYTAAWIEAFSQYQKNCNTSNKYNYFNQSATVYLPVEKLERYDHKKIKRLKQFQDKLYKFISQSKPNTTLFFTRSIYRGYFYHKNYSQISVDQFETWKKLLRALFYEFVPFVTNHTYAIFMIEHPHPKISPETCIKQFLLKRNRENSVKKMTAACPMELEYDPGVNYTRSLFTELKNKESCISIMDTTILHILSSFPETLTRNIFKVILRLVVL